MQSFTTNHALRAYLAPLRGQKIALVPTMGALHTGHLELVRRARAAADQVVVYIFVNPAQFGPQEDFNAYPRDLARDAKALSDLGLSDITIFAPDVAEIYPEPSRTQFELGDIAARWEGAARPGHFAGVALVLTKFFNIVRPDIALFGEKDFQQLQVVRQITRDLIMPVEIIGVPTVREVSGLALSSRNEYLTARERNHIAPKLYQALQSAAADIRAGDEVGKILMQQSENLVRAGFSKVDYFAYVDSETLKPLPCLMSHARLLAAATLGKARLIDNIAVS